MNQKHVDPITYDQLYDKLVKVFKSHDELDLINRAYEFALEHHKGMKRLNGDDYISHPLEVANILLDLNCDYITIAAALIHETVNHSNATFEEIKDKLTMVTENE